MARPDPERGQVVRFKYLWRREEHEGHSEGEKHRPCAVIVTLAGNEESDPQRVMLCPITHSAPEPPTVAIEIPQEAKAQAGLDDDQNWIVVSEVNKVKWSSPRFIRTNQGQWTYGVLPQETMEAVRQAMNERIKANQMDVVDRDQIDERAHR